MNTMNVKKLYIIIFTVPIVLLFLGINKIHAQKTTVVRGKVTDAKTKEPLPVVNV